MKARSITSKTLLLELLIILFIPGISFAQTESAVTPPYGFRNIQLGQQLEEVKEILKKDPLFNYRGDPDVSFLPLPKQTLIECQGNSYISRAYFQFHEDKLYIIILSLDQSKLDYYTMFSTLSGKYGDPDSLSPSDAVWRFDEVRFSLERPLTVKYIDNRVFEDLRDKGRAEEDLRDLSRKNFLKQF